MPIIRESPELKAQVTGGDDRERIEHVQKLTRRIAGLLGVETVGIRVSGTTKMGCKLTSTGIELLVNHELNEDIAHRLPLDAPLTQEEVEKKVIWGRQAGVRGTIGLHEVDGITACFLAMRARDFLDPTYGHVPFDNPRLPEASQRYLESSIDDLAAEMAMLRLEFVRRHHKAYISRQALHYMQALPMQKQLMKTLRLYLFEDDPDMMVKPAIVRNLGTVENMSPLVEELRTLLEAGLPYAERQRGARAIVEELFSVMAVSDQAGISFYEMNHLFDDEDTYGTSPDSHEDELFELEEFDAALRAEKKLEVVNEKNIDQLISDMSEDDAPEDSVPALRLPGLSDEKGSLDLMKTVDEDYRRIVEEGKAVIADLADIFIQIAQPSETLTIPRWDPRVVSKGNRLNPRAAVDAHLQLVTGTNRNVWQRVERTSRQQSRVFDGLDVMLLLDVSYSMFGDRAHYAAMTATYLIEGLQLAYSRCESTFGGGIVDIRTQLLAFGESWALLTPLATVQSDEDKKTALHVIENPRSNQTLIGGALTHVRGLARDNPDREVLCLVISDGLLADNLSARKLASAMPSNVYLGHINIGQFSGTPLTENYDSVSDPRKLPEKVRAVLERRIHGAGQMEYGL